MWKVQRLPAVTGHFTQYFGVQSNYEGPWGGYICRFWTHVLEADLKLKKKITEVLQYTWK